MLLTTEFIPRKIIFVIKSVIKAHDRTFLPVTNNTDRQENEQEPCNGKCRAKDCMKLFALTLLKWIQKV